MDQGILLKSRIVLDQGTASNIWQLYLLHRVAISTILEAIVDRKVGKCCA